MMNWTFSDKDVEAYRRSRLAWSKEWHKIRNGNMDFKEELEDLNIVYADGIQKCDEQAEELIHVVVCYMEKFCKVYRDREKLEEKLLTLRHKMGKD